MGAWIETIWSIVIYLSIIVAPLVGAWIETIWLVLRALFKFVAPLVGAWIETAIAAVCWSERPSHPSWVRGLKHRLVANAFLPKDVAPLVGAWIETSDSLEYANVQSVAPLVGAWIETF